MWGPVQQLKDMTKDERLAFLSFTSDDVREQIVSYLLDELEAKTIEFEQVEFFKQHNAKLIEENKQFKKKNKLVRYQNNKLRSQVSGLVEKLKRT